MLGTGPLLRRDEEARKDPAPRPRKRLELEQGLVVSDKTSPGHGEAPGPAPLPLCAVALCRNCLAGAMVVWWTAQALRGHIVG